MVLVLARGPRPCLAVPAPTAPATLDGDRGRGVRDRPRATAGLAARLSTGLGAAALLLGTMVLGAAPAHGAPTGQGSGLLRGLDSLPGSRSSLSSQGASTSGRGVHANAALRGRPVFAQAQAPAASSSLSAPSPTPARPAAGPAAVPAAAPTGSGPPAAPASAAPGEVEHPSPPSASNLSVPPLVAPPADPGLRLKWLEARIDQVTQVLLPARAKVGIAVLDVDSGRLLYGKNDLAPLNIASNVKLFTTAAALALLGPEYRFKTVLSAERGADRSEYKNLYLRGYGDPSMSTEDLWKLTLELSSRGIKRIKGDIIIDDSFFDDQRVGPAFEQKSQDNAYRAPQGAVSLNYNAVSVRVQPGAGDGQQPRVALDPQSPYFVISNEARTVQSGRTSLIIEAIEEKDAPPGRERTIIRVRGTIRASDSGVDVNKRVAHPDLYAGSTLLELLTRRGIQVGGKVSRGTAPPTALLVDSHYSQPLGVLARSINKHSNNFMAEQVLKSLGADASGKPGSWQKGLQAVSRYLETLGIAPGKYQMVNGSGLFDSNRFTPTQVVVLLRAAYRDFRFAADFVASLALAGADGTIGHRMAGSVAERYVRAKTGTLSGISCLSGYAGAPAPGSQPLRPPLAFAVLVNDLGEDGSVQPAKRLQDAVVEALVTYLSVGPPAPGSALK